LNNWQPIELAPKDRRILLATKSGRVDAGSFNPNYGMFLIKVPDTAMIDSAIAWQELPVFDGVIE
jgi:hypothetical protein